MKLSHMSSHRLLLSASILSLIVTNPAFSNPIGPDVVAGDVEIQGLGTDHVVVDSGSMQSIVDWEAFSIDRGEVTSINQISQDASILNRVVGNNPTEIFGTLQSNGNVFLINQSGILVGAGGVVETNGAVFSTLNVSNEDFLGGNEMLFEGTVNSDAGADIHGTIRSISNGDIFIFSQDVNISQSGHIDAGDGYVGIGAGEKILLQPNDSGDGRISILAGEGGVNNEGIIEGVSAEIKAAGGNAYAAAINNKGLVRAKGFSKSGGRIVFGSPGTIRNSGRVIAKRKVKVRSRTSIANTGAVLASNGIIGGDIIFEAPDIQLLNGTNLDVSSNEGGGRIAIGGGFKGTSKDQSGDELDIETNSQNVLVDFGAVLSADTTVEGDGGLVIVWSDDHTGFGGNISAKGGQISGNGGAVEVSGKDTLIFRGLVDTSAENGSKGTLLLDPKNVTISAIGGLLDNLYAGAAGLAQNGTIGDTADLLKNTIENANPSPDPAQDFAISGALLSLLLLKSDVEVLADQDVSFEAGAAVVWVGTENSNYEFKVDAGQDIKIGSGVIIDNTGTGQLSDDGSTTGGIYLKAGRDILIDGSNSASSVSAPTAQEQQDQDDALVIVENDPPDPAQDDPDDVKAVKSDLADYEQQLSNDTSQEAADAQDTTTVPTVGALKIASYFGDVKLEAAGKVEIKSGGYNLTIGSENGHGDIVIEAGDTFEIVAENGDVNIGSEKENVSLTAQNAFSITSEEADVKIHSEEGDILVQSTNDEVNIVAGDQAGVDRTVVIGSDKGNSEIIAKKDLKITAKGDFFYYGSEFGEISLQSEDESILIDAQNDYAVIGSEFAKTSLLAQKDVIITAGTGTDAEKAYAQIGYRVDGVRSTPGLKNGDISIEATDGDVVLAGGSQQKGSVNFAQIGHGGTLGETLSYFTAESLYANIDVKAGQDVIVTAGADLTSTATIGHGMMLFNSVASMQGVTASHTSGYRLGDISGDITVTAARDLLINEANREDDVSAFDPIARSDENFGLNDYLAVGRIGHGHIASIVDNKSGTVSPDVVFDRIQGNITLDVTENLVAGTGLTTETADSNLSVFSQIGHGGIAQIRTTADITNTPNDPHQNGTTIRHRDIRGFDTEYETDATDVADDFATNITINAGSTSLLANLESSNSAASNTENSGRNIVRSQIGHSPVSLIDSDGTALASDGQGYLVEEGRIAGDILVTDTKSDDDKGIEVTAKQKAGTANANRDNAIARVGHAGLQYVEGLKGDIGEDASNITIYQAHILGADITLDTTDSGDATPSQNQDVVVSASVEANLSNAANFNNAVAQIGHSSDSQAITLNGGDTDTNGNGNPAGDGGDIALYKGTVWDGGLSADDSKITGDSFDDTKKTTDIVVKSSNQIKLESGTRSASAVAEDNLAQSSIGHGFNIRLDTGNGGNGATLDTTLNTGRNGAAGGDILIVQSVDRREFGLDNSAYDEYASGIAGDITISAKADANADDIAIAMIASDNPNTAQTARNIATTRVGHSDTIETSTGDGGNAAISSGTGDVNDTDGDNGDSQQEAHGGRGGHIDIQLGRLTVDQGGETITTESLSLSNRQLQQNKADIGDQRTSQLSNNSAALGLQGVMLTEGDIQVDVVGQVKLESIAKNAVAASQTPILESVIGHGPRVSAVSGDGGNGGKAQFNANAASILVSERAGEEFLNYVTGIGSNRGGNAGDIRITFGDITDRETRTTNGKISISHESDADSENGADITLNITADDNAQLADSLILHTSVETGADEGTGADLASTVGHRTRIAAEAGKGGDGGNTDASFDGDANSLYSDGTGQTDTQGIVNDWNGTDDDALDETATQAGAVSKQPNTSGGRGGDVLIATNNVRGDISVTTERRTTISTGNGHGDQSKLVSTIGHSSDLLAITQAGGKAGDLLSTSSNNGIINADGTNYSYVLVDGNSDDQFNIVSLGSALTTENKDGIAVTPNDIANRRGSTFETIYNELGTGQATGRKNNETKEIYELASGVPIFHDEEADPEFIKDHQGNYVLNNEENNTLYAENAENLGRYGRVVATYDGLAAQDQENQDLFDFTKNEHPINGTLSMQVFVDMDQDGDVDLVDFDRDGRLDIVDVDRDGMMDVIDGRANYVQSASYTSSADYNEITGMGVLDYVAVTGLNFDATKTEGGWSTRQSLTTTDLLAKYNGQTKSVETSIVSDFATANGARGGDAYNQSGFTVGDITVQTGEDGSGAADSLVVSVNNEDDITNGDGNDTHRALIGHSASQISDSSAATAAQRAGRESFEKASSVNVSADGGDGGQYAVNGNGGRGGNAQVVQGATRDLAGFNGDTNLLNTTEVDHLVGNISINTETISDSEKGPKRLTLSAVTNNDYGNNLSIARIGHDAVAAAQAANKGGDAKSNGTNSQTEIANGGQGGNASVTQNQIKGSLTVKAGADSNSDGDYSVEILAQKGSSSEVSGSNNIVISQIGHGRVAQANSGKGGDGDDAQASGNGGDGGESTIKQTSILDSKVTVDLVDFASTTDNSGLFGNGLKMQAEMFEGADNVVRAQIGHSDLAFAKGGDAGDGAKDHAVTEQRGQTANGGDGGDAKINQFGYSNDITLDIGANLNGDDALVISSSAANANAGDNAHILSAVGHGGLARAVSGKGGDAGLANGVDALSATADPNLIDADFDYNNNNSNLDNANAIDPANQLVRGVDRNGGDGGDAVVQVNSQGTGRALASREGSSNDYGITDADGASINVHINDAYRNGVDAAAGHDGVHVLSKAGPGTNQKDATHVNVALIGHSGFAATIAAEAGDAVQSSGSATISEGNGGDGGDAIAEVGEIWGNVTVANIGNATSGDAALDEVTGSVATDIVIESKGGTDSDSVNHRAQSQLGHLTSGSANAGDAGKGATEAGADPSFTAINSAQGGNGGDATVALGQLTGDISATAENNVVVKAIDGVSSSNTTVASIGHSLFGTSEAGDGANGGTVGLGTLTGTTNVAVTFLSSGTVYTVKTAKDDENNDVTYYCAGGQCWTSFNADGTPQGDASSENDLKELTINTRAQSSASIYFVYEALREYHARSLANGIVGDEGTTGFDQAAYDALSDQEKKLFAPFKTYFADKPHELDHFLDRLIGNNANLVATNARDDDQLSNGNFTLGTLKSGDRLGTANNQGELETMLAIMAASGHGGNSTVVQGTIGLDGSATDQLAASGSISIKSNAKNTTDAQRGIQIIAQADSDSATTQIATVGHRAEVGKVKSGSGANLSGNDSGANGIAGDGGDVVALQYGVNGSVDLTSDHKILLSAVDSSNGDDHVLGAIGHRLDIGSINPIYRGSEPALEAGNGGSESNDSHDDGHNGNGGDIYAVQHGVVSGRARDGGTETYNTEIKLTVSQDADDNVSIDISSTAVGNSAKDVAAKLGHAMHIASAKAGDGGKQGNSTGPMGAAEGLLEGNGGDIFIEQTDLGADIDISGQDAVKLEATSKDATTNIARLQVGHERVIGIDGDTDDPNSGSITAGQGGDAVPEQPNSTALTSENAAKIGVIEDADSGSIQIITGELGDTHGDGDETLISISSNSQNIDIISNAVIGTSRLEIGNLQAVAANTVAAGSYNGTQTQSAGDIGSIMISRADIFGDIDLTTSTSGDVNLLSKATNGTADVRLGHQTEFAITAGTLSSNASGVSLDRTSLYLSALDAFVNLADPTNETEGSESGTPQSSVQATISDAQNALENIADIITILKNALGNKDRYQSSEQAALQAAYDDAVNAQTSALLAMSNPNGNSESGHSTSKDKAVALVMQQAQAVINAAASARSVFSNSSLPITGSQFVDFAKAGNIVYGPVTSKQLALSAPVNAQSNPNISIADGNIMSDSGVLRGNVTITSGELALTSQATSANGQSELGLGHERQMTNVTHYLGVQPNGVSAVVGDSGSIVANNRTEGDVTLTAQTGLIIADANAGNAETRVGHTVATINNAGDVAFSNTDQFMLNNPTVGGTSTAPASDSSIYGKRITSSDSVTGNVEIAIAELFKSETVDAGSQFQIGHRAVQKSFFADDSAGDVNHVSQFDAIVDVTVDGAIDVTAGEVQLKGSKSATTTGGNMQIGHKVDQVVAVDENLNVAGNTATGHVKSTSRINNSDNDLSLVANGSTGDIQVEGADTESLQLGHKSQSTLILAQGQFLSEQTIGNVSDKSSSIVKLQATQDIIIDGSNSQIGHFISEAGVAVGSNVSFGTTSSLTQTVSSNIAIGDKSSQGNGGVGDEGAGNNFYLFDGTIGHVSPDTNGSQLDGSHVVTTQSLDGDITIEAGTDAADDTPNGQTLTTLNNAISDETGLGDDIFISGGKVGHQRASATPNDNETQIASGDIWLRSGGDLHAINNAIIGHGSYDFNSLAITSNNSSASATNRDRIRGNTTITAGQNKAFIGATFEPNILMLDTVNVNSGYSDVGGQLRFFLSERQGLTTKDVKFNDSATNGSSDQVPDRPAGSIGNVFTEQGGNDHEHPRALASEAEPYSVTIAGKANFGFYFGSEKIVPITPATPKPFPNYVLIPRTLQGSFTPFLINNFGSSSFNVSQISLPLLRVLMNPDGTFQRAEGSENPNNLPVLLMLDPAGLIGNGAINLDELGEFLVGHSSFEITCEGFGAENCRVVSGRSSGLETGLGSLTRFSGNAGGVKNVDVPE